MWHRWGRVWVELRVGVESPVEESDMNEASSTPPKPVEHVGPTAEEYMAAHPEVDWDVNEVLYDIIDIDVANGVLKTQIVSHWVKPNYEALDEAIKELAELERVRLRTPDGDQVVLKAAFFRQIYADHCKYLALEAAGVDAWEGYSEAMADAQE